MELPHKILDNKAKHIMSVASMCYKIAQEKGLSETDCKKAYVTGYLHDIGYAFSKVNKEHPNVGCELLELCGCVSDDILDAVKYHGTPNVPQNMFLAILNQADLQVNCVGEVVSVQERLEDIGTRYGLGSREHTNSSTVARQCGLITDKEIVYV